MREQILTLQDRLRQYEEKEEVKHNVVAIVPKSEEPEIEEQKQVLSNKEIFRRYAYGYSNNFYEFGLQQYGKNIKLQIFTGYDSKAYIITEDRCYKSKNQYSDLNEWPFVFTHKTLGWIIKLDFKAKNSLHNSQYNLEVNCVKFEDMAVVQSKTIDAKMKSLQQEERKLVNREVFRRYTNGDLSSFEFGFQQEGKNYTFKILKGQRDVAKIITYDRCYDSRTRYSELLTRPFVFTHKTTGWIVKLGFR